MNPFIQRRKQKFKLKEGRMSKMSQRQLQWRVMRKTKKRKSKARSCLYHHLLLLKVINKSIIRLWEEEGAKRRSLRRSNNKIQKTRHSFICKRLEREKGSDPIPMKKIREIWDSSNRNMIKSLFPIWQISAAKDLSGQLSGEILAKKVSLQLRYNKRDSIKHLKA